MLQMKYILLKKKLLEHLYYKIKQVLKLILKITKPVGLMEKGTGVRLLKTSLI